MSDIFERHRNPCYGGERLDFGHLGGTSTGGDPDSWFPELWDFLVTAYDVKSALDVGCGVGYAQRYLAGLGLEAHGMDCRQVLASHLTGERVHAHDLTDGPFLLPEPVDLVWSCEVGEHLEERFADHVVRTVADNARKLVGFCAAPPGCGGYHHVNCQPPEYWAEKFANRGLKLDIVVSALARKMCGLGSGRSPNNYFARSGIILVRDKQ